jgi:UDP-2-acetamido-3-amino-2,3-dideoxy-glucuronate N-acetyltransferase
MTTDSMVRDDRDLVQNLSLIAKMLLGFSVYIPFSWIKKAVYTILGAQIGKNVYFGPGSLLISNDFHNVRLGDSVFVAPGVMIRVNHLFVGAQSTIGYQCLLVGDHMSIGSRCNISNRAFIESSYAPVSIGNNVTIAASCIISSHDGAYRQVYGLPMKKEPVSIKDMAFIGNGAIILPGVEIGERAIVGAGAVVTKSVDAGVVVAGVPARVIKKCVDILNNNEIRE